MKAQREMLDDMIQYGFDLAIRYAELAVLHDRDPVEFMKEQLAKWKEKRV